MSNHLAIATVTAALRQALQEAVAADVPGADVTTTRPDRARPAEAGPVANLFLYQVTPNAAWRNADVPMRDAGGRTVQRPRTALDLHYLVSFYGEEGQLEPQRLMGSVVRQLHQEPILARSRIEQTLSDRTFGFLSGSDLAEQVETVKFSPAALSLEELSKLWSVFFQTPYSLSIAYDGTVVLIDGDDTAVPSKLVHTRIVHLGPFRRTTIKAIAPAGGADKPIVADSQIVVEGTGLGASAVRARVGKADLEAVPVSDTQLAVDLASARLGALRAGVQSMQIIPERGPGDPLQPASNALPIALRPTIDSVEVSEPAPEEAMPPQMVVRVRPVVGHDQDVSLLLRPLEDDQAPAVTLPAPPRAEDADAIAFPLGEVIGDVEEGDFEIRRLVQTGVYLLALQVDGLESPLDVDRDTASPSYLRYVGPTVTVP